MITSNLRLPTLYHKGKTGATSQWTIWTEGADVVTEYGQIDGKMQIARKTEVAKNVGRSNATSPSEQAQLKAKAMWQHRIDRKHSLTIDAAQQEVFLPMLASDFKGSAGNKVSYPCDVQPKLDGVRAMAYWDGDRVYLGTRSGKEWTAPKHINAILEKIMPRDMVLDGELYLHGIDFETLSSWTKKLYPQTETMEFHVFDMPINADGERNNWASRKAALALFASKYFHKYPALKAVPTNTVSRRADVLEAEEHYVNEGYEGAIVRDINGEYTFGHRSRQLLKVKSSIDSEYKVVDAKDGVGRDKGCVIWVCVTKDGKEFDVRPKGTLERRAEQFKNKAEYIGQWLKVRFQNLTKDGIPRFPRGVGFRDVRDMS